MLSPNNTTFWNEKRVAFFDSLELPPRTRVQLEVTVCLGKYYEEFRQLMEPSGWRLREAVGRQFHARKVPGLRPAIARRVQLRETSVRHARDRVGERPDSLLSGQRPAGRRAAHGRQPTPAGRRRSGALAAAEADYERHCRQARALAEEHFDARRIVARVLERALE